MPRITNHTEFASDLSEGQTTWREYQERYKIPDHPSESPMAVTGPTLRGTWLDGFLHARGWRLDPEADHQYMVDDRAPGPVSDKIRSLERQLEDAALIIGNISKAAIPMLLWCPECGQRHIDAGEFETKLHHTHACQGCGMVWRPAINHTKGVQFLPGFKNDHDQDQD